MERLEEESFKSLERTIRLGTSLSSIGAMEHAFNQLGTQTLNNEFASDIDTDCKKA